MWLISDTWLDSGKTTTTTASAGLVSGLVLLLITVAMATVLAVVWRRYRVRARQQRFSPMSCPMSCKFCLPPHHRHQIQHAAVHISHCTPPICPSVSSVLVEFNIEMTQNAQISNFKNFNFIFPNFKVQLVVPFQSKTSKVEFATLTKPRNKMSS